MFTADVQLGKNEDGWKLCSDIITVFMWNKELNLSAPVNIMSSNGWNFQGGRFQNFVTIRTVEKQNELSSLDVNSLKLATMYNVEPMQVTILGT